VIADRHELNSKGLHVTAFAVSGASHRSTATNTTTIAQSAAPDAFFILKFVTP
jgi:PhoPQ-activated pathogenicity-related protein